eukprot:TRINITY_DN10699_c0_g1_i9.p1 TRINITY_DN10699_c0_g1~~TRINITY_DN10699_c0_g1_i9.p1  ORF type:complete len:262 (+),score=77.25 TRINITY_DN10699_c0_g1_i9:1698-2483(+)
MSEVSSLRKEVDSKRKALNTLTSVQGYPFDKGKVYKCKLCEGKFFVSKDFLKAHYRKRHDGDIEGYTRKPITLTNMKERPERHTREMPEELNKLSGRVEELSNLVKSMHEKGPAERREELKKLKLRESKTMTGIVERTHKPRSTFEEPTTQSKRSIKKPPEVKETPAIIEEAPGNESEKSEKGETTNAEPTKEEKIAEESDNRELSESKDNKVSWIDPPEDTREYRQKAISQGPRNRSMTSGRIARDNEFRLGKSMCTTSL